MTTTPDWGGFAVVPEDKWNQLSGGVPGTHTSSSGGREPWKTYAPERHRERLHPATVEMLTFLVDNHGVDPTLATFHDEPGREPYLKVIRPGKTAGTSATLGAVGPGVLFNFSSSWPGLRSDTAYDLDSLAGLSAKRVEENGVITAAAGLNDEMRMQLLADPRKLEMLTDELRRRDVRALADRIEREREPLPPLNAFLLGDVPDERIDFLFNGLLVVGGRMLFVAQRKTGKTTMGANLAYAYLHGTPALGRFETSPTGRKVAFLNYEMTAAQQAVWLRETGIPGDRALVLSLRGTANPLATDRGRQQLVELLKSNDVGMAIVDPFGRAYNGKSQNDAGEVGAWLVALDLTMNEAGVDEVILFAHAGWDAERTRGTSALEDWGDTVATMLTDKDSGQRFMRAIGRDIDIEEDRLDFVPGTRQLTFAGIGSRKVARESEKVEALLGPLVEIVRAKPGLTTNDITKELRDRALPVQSGLTTQAAKMAVTRKLIEIRPGSRRSTLHFPTDPTAPDCSQDQSTTAPTALYREQSQWNSRNTKTNPDQSQSETSGNPANNVCAWCRSERLPNELQTVKGEKACPGCASELLGVQVIDLSQCPECSEWLACAPHADNPNVSVPLSDTCPRCDQPLQLCDGCGALVPPMRLHYGKTACVDCERAAVAS